MEAWPSLLPFHQEGRMGVSGLAPYPDPFGMFRLHHGTKIGESVRVLISLTDRRAKWAIMYANTWYRDLERMPKWCGLLLLRWSLDIGDLKMKRCGCCSYRAHDLVILRVPLAYLCDQERNKASPPFSLI